MDRKTLKEAACKVNDIGGRIYWTRNKLRLKSIEVCSKTNIPTSSYCDRESGLRSYFYEELLILAYYFDERWHNRFRAFNSYPSFKGKEVRDISFMWLIFGFDQNREDLDLLVQNIKETYDSRESELMAENEQLRSQLSLEDFIKTS